LHVGKIRPRSPDGALRNPGFRSALSPDSAKLHPGYPQRSCHQHRITGRPDRFDKPVRSDFCALAKSGHVARMEPCGIRGFRSALSPDSAKLHPGYHQRSCHQHRITGRPDRFDKPVRSDFCALAKSGHVARMEPCGIRGFRSALSPDSAKLHPGYHQRSCHQHRITGRPDRFDKPVRSDFCTLAKIRARSPDGALRNPGISELRSALSPDSAKLHPGYHQRSCHQHRITGRPDRFDKPVRSDFCALAKIRARSPDGALRNPGISELRALSPDSAKLHPGYHQRSCHQHRITGRPDRFDKPVRSDFCTLAKSGHVARMEPCGIRGFLEFRSALSPDSAKLHPGYHQRSCHQHRITGRPDRFDKPVRSDFLHVGKIRPRSPDGALRNPGISGISERAIPGFRQAPSGLPSTLVSSAPDHG
jgi:hypothetical protein